jgi:hypothetical protein
LVWIDVWAWADVPAAGQPGCMEPGWGARGAVRGASQSPIPASAAWHQVPPPSSSPPEAAVSLCRSGACARVGSAS